MGKILCVRMCDFGLEVFPTTQLYKDAWITFGFCSEKRQKQKMQGDNDREHTRQFWAYSFSC